jgi:DNA-binding NtrC family response regulator
VEVIHAKKSFTVNQKRSEISDLVRLRGYLVDEAKSVRKALKAILDGKYALIISDLATEGLQTLGNVKTFCPAVPVVLTSDEHILTRNETIQLGAQDLIETSELASDQMKRLKSLLDRLCDEPSGVPELPNPMIKVA